jgi:hypothetical protein
MVTLCGEPDWCILLWQHDMFKILARIDLGFNDPMTGCAFQMSYRNVSTELVVTLTGAGVYRWIEVNNAMNGFKVMHSQLSIEGEGAPNRAVQDNYTCHAWDSNNRLIVCNADGDILVCDYKGQFLSHVKDSPFGNRIECIQASSHGLVVAGQNNYIWSYEQKDQKEQRPTDIPIYYSLLHAKFGTDEKSDTGKDSNRDESITSLAISLNEDYIFAIDR